MQKTQTEGVWVDCAPQRLSWSGLVQKLSSSNSIDSDSEHSGADDCSDTGKLHTIFSSFKLSLLFKLHGLFIVSELSVISSPSKGLRFILGLSEISCTLKVSSYREARWCMWRLLIWFWHVLNVVLLNCLGLASVFLDTSDICSTLGLENRIMM